MKKLKQLTLVLVLLLLCGIVTVRAERLSYSLGDQMQDFTFTTYDGQTIAFSDVLKEKEAALINIWATWCWPCKSEFPYMQQAYEEYQDRVEIIALTCESTDTNEKLASFAKEYGLTFMVGQDPVDFMQALQINSIPITMMIDRYGTICMIESGAQTSKEAFVRMFDAFLGGDYTESVLYRGIPAAKPNVDKVSDADLTAAVEAEATNPTNERIWPMLPAEKDGRQVLTSSNAGQASSEAAVLAKLTAKAGEAITVTFKTSIEPVFDLMKIHVNGELVKVFSGEHDWMDYAIPVLQDGEYEVKISYVKDRQGDTGADAIWVDRVCLADDSQAAMQNNPAYPLSDELQIGLSGDQVREIIMEDATGLLYNTFGDARYFIANAPQAQVLATLSDRYDPEAAFFYINGNIFPLMDCIQSDGFTMHMDVDSAATTGYACTAVMLYLDSTGTKYQAVVVFQDAENVDLLCTYNKLGTWVYADVHDSLDLALPSQMEYIFKCVDENGVPVEGVMLQICDETTCQVLITDANGSCTLTSVPYAWEVHVLMAPEGYTVSEKNAISAPVLGGEMVLVLMKE